MYEARLEVLGDEVSEISVVLDVTDEALRIDAVNGTLGEWSHDQLRVTALDDGFHVRADGEEIVLHVERDAEFALAMGLRSAPPQLRRKMAALIHRDNET